MTVAEYATHCGRSDSIIRRYRRNGLVISCTHGKIDVVATDRSLLDNLHPLRGGDRTEPPPTEPPASASMPNSSGAQSAPDRASASTPLAFDPPPGQPGQSLPSAVLRERLAIARLREIELGEKGGQLINKADAHRATVTLVRQAIVRLRLMGSKLRNALAAETDPRKVELMIDDEVNVICEDFRKSAALITAGEAVAEAMTSQAQEAA